MLVVIRGAGDLATGIALRLHRAGYQIVMTDLPAPTSIRRTVCFSEAIRLGEMTVEDISARKAETPEEALTLAQSGIVAVLADPTGACIPTLRPGAMVDAILAKKNLGTALTDAPVVIGVGPGFTVGIDCHAAVETMRGHTLGRALYTGSPLPNTGIPGLIGGRSGERVLRAPADGIFEPRMEIGQLVQEGEIAATVNGKPMRCTLTGCLRGLLQGLSLIHIFGVISALLLAQTAGPTALDRLIHIAPAADHQTDKRAERQAGGHSLQYKTGSFIHGELLLIRCGI